MGFKIGICGIGQFGSRFVPLFKAHPLIDDVYLADVIEERAAGAA